MVNHITAAIRENKKDSILAPVFVCAEVLFEVLIPIVMASLIDKGIDAGNMSEILRLGVILIVMAMCALAFGILSGVAAANASAGLARNLRHDIYYHVQDFSFANIDKFSTAGIVTRLTTDVTNVQNAYQMIIRVAVRSPVMLIFAFIMTIRISPSLSMIYVCAIPLLGIGLAPHHQPRARSVYARCSTPTTSSTTSSRRTSPASAWSSPLSARTLRRRSSARSPRSCSAASSRPSA